MRALAQRFLDWLEGVGHRRQWVGFTFRVLQLKRALGLRYIK